MTFYYLLVDIILVILHSGSRINIFGEEMS